MERIGKNATRRGVKKCPICHRIQTAQNSNRRIIDGRQYWNGLCRRCSVSATKKYRHRAIEPQLLAGARSRATRFGFEFNLVLTDIIIPLVCPVLGIPLKRIPGQRAESSPTLDRLDPAKGYTKTNIAVISWRANRLKSNATLQELERLVAFVRERKS